jgi:lysyl-tRNA synthetase class II
MKGLVARTEALFRHVVRAVKGALAVEITPKVSSAEEPHARKAVILDFSKPFARVHVLKAIFKKRGFLLMCLIKVIIIYYLLLFLVYLNCF